MRPLVLGDIVKDEQTNKTADIVLSPAVQDLDGKQRSISPDIN